MSEPTSEPDPMEQANASFRKGRSLEEIRNPQRDCPAAREAGR